MIQFDEYFVEQVVRVFTLSLLSFMFSMVITPIYTYFAFKHKFWKQKRTTSVTGEKLQVIKKLSTRKHPVPTMAGVIFLFSTAIVTVAFNLDRQQTWLPLAALVGGGFVGMIDDFINVRGTGLGVAGMRAPVKFAMITIAASIGAWFFYYKLGYSTIHLPALGDVSLGIWLMPLFVLAVVSTGNAVNISDGLDGLAGGLAMSAYSAFGFIAILQGHFGIAAFCFSIAGALLSYIWFNIPPARFFMGDAGSFSLGMALGVVAMLTDTLFLLPIIGFVFVMEAGSTLLQIVSKKVFKRRIFTAAPIHHHFEAADWPKTKVTMRFWVLGQLCALLGIIIALVGDY